MSTAAMIRRFTAPPPRNVGGGDMVTRLFAIVALLLLAGLIASKTKVHYPQLKISLLVVAELGLINLMLGLFLRSKTYSAGLHLFFGSLSMLWLAGKGLPWIAIAVGVAFVIVALVSVLTRRSRLNAMLELSSMRVPLEEVEAAAAALASDAAKATGSKSAHHAAHKTTEGEAR